jgi:integrase
MRVLREHREIQTAERALAGPAYFDQDLIFAHELGGSIHPQRLTESFARLRRAAGLPTGTLHVLRHTAATLALTEDVPSTLSPPRRRPEDGSLDVCPPATAVQTS